MSNEKGDLISRSALIENAKLFEATVRARGCGKSIMHFAKTWLFAEVRKAPAVDAVEVVRCKDCDKSEPSNVWDGWVFCQANKIHHRDDNFCSYGERRDGE